MTPPKYKLLPHTSDVLFEAHGRTLEEALENAALAMFETLADTKRLGEERHYDVDERSHRLEDLVSITLGDLLSLSDAENVFFKRLHVAEVKCSERECRVKGTAYGETRTRAKGRTDVKAVTFHETRAHKTPDGWVVRVLLDI